MILIITLITGKWADRIIGELVRAGYQVKPGMLPNTTTLETHVSTTMVLLLVKKDLKPMALADHVEKILAKLGASYHNITCFDGEGALKKGVIFTSPKPPAGNTPRPAVVESLLSDEEPFEDAS